MLAKQCKCKDTTASGPRWVVTKEWKDHLGQLRVKVKYVTHACDSCDTPWEEKCE